jgi:hypothetical protein
MASSKTDRRPAKLTALWDRKQDFLKPVSTKNRRGTIVIMPPPQNTGGTR